jgi:secondary thiamine-phosphate synthase enzyme
VHDRNRSTIELRTAKRTEMVDITASVEDLLTDLDIRSGLCHLYCPHTTAGLTVNEGADPAVARDVATTLDRLIPRRGDYHHMEGNSDAHVKSSSVGVSLTLGIDEGTLALGRWQRVFFCEFDGPRSREIWVRFFYPEGYAGK